MINNDDKPGPPVKTLIVWDDLGYAVRWWGDDYSITFDVLHVTGRDDDGTAHYEKSDCISPEEAETLDEASVYVHGLIKWDGCSHLSYPETAHCMQHICGLKSWLDFANLIARLPTVLFPMIPKHSTTDAG